MSEPNSRKEIGHLVEALDIEPEESTWNDSVQRLGIDVKSWAADIRTRAAKASAAARQERFSAASNAYASDLSRLERRSVRTAASIADQMAIMKSLLARAPTNTAVHYHKFEEATADELAEMIRALRHLLGEDEE